MRCAILPPLPTCAKIAGNAAQKGGGEQGAEDMSKPVAAPPDPHPKTPRLRCPPGAIDSQVHLFGPKARFAFAPGSKYVSEDMLPETQIAVQDALGISRAVVVSGGGYGVDMSHLEYVMENFRDRFIGVALLPDDVGADYVRHLDGLGVRATRFINPRQGGALPPISRRVAALVADIGWHVHYYPFGDELKAVSQALLDLPCDVVLDHFAHIPAAGGVQQPAFQSLLRLLDTGRFWVKMSAPMRITMEEPPYPSVTPLARALVAHRPDRMLWASDWPHVNLNGRTMPNDGDLLDLLLTWAPDTDTRRQILVDNPRRLFRLNEKD